MAKLGWVEMESDHTSPSASPGLTRGYGKNFSNLSPVFWAASYWVRLVLEGIPDRPGLGMGADGLVGCLRVTNAGDHEAAKARPGA